MKYIYLLAFIMLAACSGVSSKNDDLMSPCAGCDDRVSPIGNLTYINLV